MYVLSVLVGGKDESSNPCDVRCQRFVGCKKELSKPKPSKLGRGHLKLKSCLRCVFCATVSS